MAVKPYTATYAGTESGRSREEATLIRSAARKSAFSSPVPRACAVCGYDVHVEVCHIKPVCRFHKSAAMRDINADSNLTFLCPTHHWEFDHGALATVPPSLKQIMETPARDLARILRKRRLRDSYKR